MYQSSKFTTKTRYFIPYHAAYNTIGRISYRRNKIHFWIFYSIVNCPYNPHSAKFFSSQRRIIIKKSHYFPLTIYCIDSVDYRNDIPTGASCSEYYKLFHFFLYITFWM